MRLARRHAVREAHAPDQEASHVQCRGRDAAAAGVARRIQRPRPRRDHVVLHRRLCLRHAAWTRPGRAPTGRQAAGPEGISIALRRDSDIDYGDDRHWTCGDRGVSEWTIRGTQATGEAIEVRGCDLFEFADGKISRKASFWKIVD